MIPDIDDWLPHAADYARDWLGYQVRSAQLPGCVLAIAKGGRIVAEQAYGLADLSAGEPMTVDHRFRVASHSKTFTAAGVLKLREQARLRLDDRVGVWIDWLPPETSAVTIGQLLAHGGGLMRDGLDAPHWQNRGAFFDAARLRDQLARPLTFPPNSAFKYSNLGYALAGQIIEAVTGEPYGAWIAREIVRPSGLAETTPDLPIEGAAPIAAGHSGRLPLGERRTLSAWVPTNALAAATGFTSTARDLVRFFAGLDPAAETGILTPESRREMIRRQWVVPHRAEPRWYGLGTIHGEVASRAWYGHWGSFPGFITRTSHLPDWNITVSILTNAIDGDANSWCDAIIGIMHRFSQLGAPAPEVAGWKGRWWTIWRPIDFVPAGGKVLLADPASLTPLAMANEIVVLSATEGRISLADGITHPGERVLRSLDDAGAPTRIQLGGNRLLRESDLTAEMVASGRKP